jgi:hypothetical protein
MRIPVCVDVERTTSYIFWVEAQDETEAGDIADEYLFDWEEIALEGVEEIEETTGHAIYTGDDAL